MLNLNVPIWQLTGQEFLELTGLNKKQESENVQVPRRYVYGISGLARLANCSNPTAQKLKNSGRVPFMQHGRKIVFDVDAVLDAMKNNPAKVIQ
jgi:hypothetical protein